MANYYTRFSCVLPLGSRENVTRAHAVFAAYEAALVKENEMPDFCIRDDAGSELLITSGEGSGDPDKVLDYVGRVGLACGLTGVWGFVWSYTCDRNRTDGFGGGAVVLDLADGRVIDSLSCDTWLVRRLGQAAAAPKPDPVKPAVPLLH